MEGSTLVQNARTAPVQWRIEASDYLTNKHDWCRRRRRSRTRCDARYGAPQMLATGMSQTSCEYGCGCGHV